MPIQKIIAIVLYCAMVIFVFGFLFYKIWSALELGNPKNRNIRILWTVTSIICFSNLLIPMIVVIILS